MEKTVHDILKTLAYFDIFNYPLTNEEVRRFLPKKCDQCVVDGILRQLLTDHFIYKVNGFYSFQNQRTLSETRIAGNKRATELLKVAQRAAKVLSWFPFVQSVAVSGSLSKNYADEKADIDFFIITSENRLWIARTCMHIFKKFTFLAGKQNWFCMNYYVDEMRMEIIEKNVFTAMEIVTLMPLQGTKCFENFIKANAWTNDYFQQQAFPKDQNVDIKRHLFRKVFEKIFSSKFGDAFEKRLMNITDRRWKLKTRRGKLNSHGMAMVMMTDPHFSKPDPGIFQEKIVRQFQEKLAQYGVDRICCSAV